MPDISQVQTEASRSVSRFTNLFDTSVGAEKLTFRRYPGSVVKQAAREGTAIDNSKVTVVSLKVNPESLSYSKRKVVQKVQTNAPGRFIVFDWGSELTVLSINGNTGNLLPDSIVKGSLGGLNQLVQNVASIIDPSSSNESAKLGSNTAGGNAMQRAILGKFSYTDVLDMSPKYRTFKKLEKMFDVIDTDQDILTLDVGDVVYRGFFEEFTFEVTADSPWNWKYTIVFTILSDLSAMLRRWDETYNTSDFIG